MQIVIIAVLAILGIVAVVAAWLYLAPEHATRFVIDRERSRAGLTRKQVDLPDGLRYVYLEGGQGDPLVLLHGFGANKDNFVRVAGALTRRYRVIIPDHIGFGESSHPPEADYSPLAQVHRLHALMSALGMSQIHLGGSSMGGQIALSYAAAYPQEVKSLWLLDPAGLWTATESELLRVKRETGRNLLLAANADEFDAVLRFVTAKTPFIPAPIRRVMAQERIANHRLESRIADELLADSIEQRIAGIAVPALIVWGDQDRAIHVDSAQVLQGLLPRSKTVIMRGIGHLPHIESPRQSVADYLHFRTSEAGS